MIMNKFEVEPNVNIAFNYTGSPGDDALVICHGLGASHLQWEKDAEYFSKYLPVLTLDLRGHGESSEVPNGSPEDYTLEKMASDVETVIRNCGIENVVILGNSLGGVVALEMIRRNRVSIKSLITCGTTFKLNLPSFVLWVKRFVYWMKRKNIAEFIANQSTKSNSAAEIIRKMYEVMSFSVIRYVEPNILKYDYLDVARDYKGYISIIQGELDSAINRELKSTEAALEGRENVMMSNLPDVGHFTNLDNPVLFREEVIETLLKSKILVG